MILPSTFHLPQEDVEMVVLAALVDGPKERDDLERITKWARDAYTDAQVLKLILAGEIVPSWDRDTEDLIVKIAPPKTEAAAP